MSRFAVDISLLDAHCNYRQLVSVACWLLLLVVAGLSEQCGVLSLVLPFPRFHASLRSRGIKYIKGPT